MPIYLTARKSLLTLLLLGGVLPTALPVQAQTEPTALAAPLLYQRAAAQMKKGAQLREIYRRPARSRSPGTRKRLLP